MFENHEIEMIFSKSLVEDIDDETAWKAVNELRSIGTREVFEFAIVQTHSASWIARVRAVDVIAQLGNSTGQWHPYRKEAGELIKKYFTMKQTTMFYSHVLSLLGTSATWKAFKQFVGFPRTLLLT